MRKEIHTTNHLTSVRTVLQTSGRITYRGSKNILWYGIDLFLDGHYNIINNWKYIYVCSCNITSVNDNITSVNDNITSVNDNITEDCYEQGNQNTHR